MNKKNLFQRIVTGAILLPIVIFAIFYGGYPLKVILLLIGLMSALEITSIVLPKNRLGAYLAVFSWAALIFPILLADSLQIMGASFFALFFIFNLFFLFNNEPDQKLYEKLAFSFYFISYVFIGLACFYWLQNNSNLPRRVGVSFIMLSCISTWTNDSFAYFGGVAFGKRPLFLSVSQKKTWEGFIAGALGSIISVFIIYALFLEHKYHPFLGLTLKDILWVLFPSLFFAPIGDLIESRLKRIYHTKDSSNILPGHGGILDRIDGLILVLPWTFIYAYFIRPL